MGTPEALRPDLRAATVVSGAIVGTALAADVVFVRRNLAHPELPPWAMVTDAFRHPAGVAFLTVFGLHLAGALGRLDPFHLLGAAASWRRP